MKISDGMTYAPKGKPCPVVKPGEFLFSAAHLDHGHIYGMVGALIEAGGTLKSVYDPQPERLAKFLKTYPQAETAPSEEALLADPETVLVAGAHITSERGPFGCRVMAAGKDYFTDKAPFTTLEQLEEAKRTAAATGRKYMVYYSERLHVEGAILAGYMIEQGEIGKGILCDIGSHQIEQYLYFAGEEDARVAYSRIGNYANPDHPELDDFGDCSIVGAKGSTNYFRVDWFTPDGLRTWGDGRTLILGTEGYIEIRKYVDIATQRQGGDHVFLVNGRGEQYFDAHGVTGYPFFGQLILDCLERTETAMTQAHAFKAAELCLRAQAQAVRVR